MSEPLKKELESIDQELELAMAQLSESTQRVDEILAGFSADETAEPRERKPTLALHTADESADVEDTAAAESSSDEDEPPAEL